MTILRILAKVFTGCLWILIAPIMFVFWLFIFAPVLLFMITIVNIIEFGNHGKDSLWMPYDIILWFFWLFVMWDLDKAEDYV